MGFFKILKNFVNVMWKVWSKNIFIKKNVILILRLYVKVNVFFIWGIVLMLRDKNVFYRKFYRLR